MFLDHIYICIKRLCFILLFVALTLPDTSFFFKERLEDVEDFVYTPGDRFSINFDMQTTSAGSPQDNYCQVLLAKNDKAEGHFEVWLYNGELAFYAPELNNGDAIYSGHYVNDGKWHNITVVYGDGIFKFYDNGEVLKELQVSGTISNIPAKLTFKRLNDGTYQYNGKLRNLAFYNKVLTESQIDELYNLRKQEWQEEGMNTMLVTLADEGLDLKRTDNGRHIVSNFDVNIGSSFSITGVVRTSQKDGIAVIFAKGDKINGHYEVWLNNGELAFYAPEMNFNSSVYSGVNIADGKKHHFAVVYDGEILMFYVDGKVKSGSFVSGHVSDSVMDASIGALIDGTFPYEGYIEDLTIYNYPLDVSEIRKILPKDIEVEILLPEEFHVEGNGCKPDEFQPTVPLRGISRLVYPQALPLVDFSAMVNYEGSISKAGDNADWDWGMYQDEKGEWVLMETYGPGCLYNFTQHRYPTSPEPTFRFYFDDEKEPRYEIKLSEFGRKEPFVKPLADIYEGPEDGGRGPIWVVRSFIPMEFKKYCKVTSDIKLEGHDKAKGEGGWGHITYVKYDTYNVYKREIGVEKLKNMAENHTHDPKYSEKNEYREIKGLTIKAGESVKIFDKKAEGSIASIKLYLAGENVTHSVLKDLWIRIYWDGHEESDVSAPIGTFFGNQYNLSGCENHHLMLGMSLKLGEYLKCYNYFPMPFWERAVVELNNSSMRDIDIHWAEIGFTPSSVCRYDKQKTGYFVSSEYYPKTENVQGKNSVIANVEGSGHMVYGVMSGYGIMNGCEGDVRVFIDGRKSPEIESDGSESWASYGWGFVTPPQANPFSGYNGAYNSNSYWSMVRLMLGDSYYFKQSIRFELEHGGANEGLGCHSGQIFLYMLPESMEAYVVTDEIDVSDKESLDKHDYTVTGSYDTKTVYSAYANGINTDSKEGLIHVDFNGRISFYVNIDKNNRGVILNRTSSQQVGRHCANIYVDDVLVEEAKWYYADNNPYYQWLDDSFQIPEKYTKGKDRIRITIEPVEVDGVKTWNHAKYQVVSLLFREEIAQEELVNPDVKDKFFTLPLLLALGLLVVAGTAVHYIRRKKREGS